MVKRRVISLMGFCLALPGVSFAVQTFHYLSLGNDVELGALYYMEVPSDGCLFDVYFKQDWEAEDTYWIIRWTNKNSAVININGNLRKLSVTMTDIDLGADVGSAGTITMRQEYSNIVLLLKKTSEWQFDGEGIFTIDGAWERLPIMMTYDSSCLRLSK